MLVLIKLKLALLQYKNDYKMGKSKARKEAEAEVAQDRTDATNAFNKAIADATNQSNVLKGQLNDLTNSRQPVINPYADVTNTYAGLTNEFANLGVANKASEFQAEEADIALANTLDTMRASGAGAGGATALAQAALKSKRGISASLQQQEAANQKASAQGAANVAKLKAQGESAMQMAQAQGKQFAFSATENREQQDIDRASKELDNQRQAIADANASYTAALLG